jgi:hypothetical protein
MIVIKPAQCVISLTEQSAISSSLTFAITGSAQVIFNMQSQRHRGVRVHGVVSNTIIDPSTRLARHLRVHH